MIARHLEPDHHLEDYLMCDDADFIQIEYCINSEEDEPCTFCGHCERMYFASTEDEEDSL